MTFSISASLISIALPHLSSAMSLVQTGGRKKYETQDAAAMYFMRKWWPESTRLDLEFGSRICRTFDGKYIVTYPRRGTKDRVAARNCPRGTTKAGRCHTHGRDPDDMPGLYENFSDFDKWNAIKEGVPTYLGAPSGTVYRYTKEKRIGNYWLA